MFNLGMGEITVILLLALIFLGPSKLPELAAGLGKMIREIRKATSDVKNEIALDDSFRKPFEELRDAVTLHPEELKRRDRIKQELEEARRRMEEELARAAAEPAVADPAEGSVTPPPVVADAAPAAAAVPAVPAPAAPSGTVARPQTNRRMPVGPATGATPGAPHAPPAPSAAAPSETPRPPQVPNAPRVVPPTSSADRANTTQILSEEDLMPTRPPAAPGPAVPPPLPGIASGRVGPPPGNRPPPGGKKA